MSEYYEIDKPFSRENWNKLIGDLNELFQNPPGDCEAVDTIDEVEENHIWTKQDVEEVREKIEEMCPGRNWDWDGFPRLEKPWNKKIIDEIEDQMVWCDCGIERINLAMTYPELASINGECGIPVPRVGDLVQDVIDGMQVDVSGYSGRFWKYTIVGMNNAFSEEWWRENRTQTIENGEINCEGQIVYDGHPNRRIPTAMYTYFSKHPSYPCDHLVNSIRLTSAQNQVDYKISHDYRTSVDLYILNDFATPEECV